MNNISLFKPDFEATQIYRHKVSDLFYKLGYSSAGEIIEDKKIPIQMGSIQFVIRSLGLPSGGIPLISSCI